MRVFRALVATNVDPTLDCTIWATDPAAPEGDPINVTYLSPISNIDTGFFAKPTKGSEIFVLESTTFPEIAAEGGSGVRYGDPQVEYIYLGSVVGSKQSYGKSVNEKKLNEDPKNTANPKPNLDSTFTLHDTSLGADSAQGPQGLSLEARKAYDGKVIVPEQQVWEGPAGHFLKFSDQSSFGTGAGYINCFAEFASGFGKSLKMWDVPGQNMIEISPGNGLLDRIYFCGAQDTVSSEKHTFAEGELRVDTAGPIRLLSKSSRIDMEVLEGFNIDVWNQSTGFMNPEFQGADPFLTVGGGNAWAAGEEDLFNPYAPNTPEYSAFVKELTGVIPLPKASFFQEGQLHPDIAPAKLGGNPLSKGNEGYGCVNVTSEWNNINLEAFGPDSVIHINAPDISTKIVITTGGTVDIVATQKVSITSGEKIELNAPYIDLNSTIRVDID